MNQTVLGDLFSKGTRTFRFPLPGENDDVWRCLVVYDREGRRVRALNLRTGKESYFSAAEVVIPVIPEESKEISVSEGISKREVVEKARPTRKEHWLSRPVHKGIYVSLVLLFCLSLYLFVFISVIVK